MKAGKIIVIVLAIAGMAALLYFVRFSRAVNPPTVLYEPMRCGGIAGSQCSKGYVCQYQDPPTVSDRAGYCTSAASLPDKTIGVYKKFCEGNVVSQQVPSLSGKSQEEIQRIVARGDERNKKYKAMSVEKIDSLLLGGKVAPADLHAALFYRGLSVFEKQGDFDESVQMFQCTAERYGSVPAMIKLVQIYGFGSQSVLSTTKKNHPEFVIRAHTPISQDCNRGDEWIRKVARAFDEGYIDDSVDEIVFLKLMLGWKELCDPSGQDAPEAFQDNEVQEKKVPKDPEDRQRVDRNQRRREHLRQLESSLEIYYGFNYKYPPSIRELVKGKWISMDPPDPLLKGPYAYCSTGRSYVLASILEQIKQPIRMLGNYSGPQEELPCIPKETSGTPGPITCDNQSFYCLVGGKGL